MWKHFGVT